MGNRYILYVTCPVCGFEDQDAYYAPTCGFLDWVCPTCDHKVDLEKLTGITYEDASNADLIAEVVKAISTPLELHK